MARRDGARVADGGGERRPALEGLTWAMIPSHSSGVCACVPLLLQRAEPAVCRAAPGGAHAPRRHLAFASWRLAASNGWEFALPSFGDDGAAAGAGGSADETAAAPDVAAGGGGAAVDASGGEVGGLLQILALSIVMAT